jgi:hypothetical protein
MTPRTKEEQEVTVKRWREQAIATRDVCIDATTAQVFVVGRHDLEIAERVIAVPMPEFLRMAAAVAAAVYQVAAANNVPPNAPVSTSHRVS